jgi:hypothetical protein
LVREHFAGGLRSPAEGEIARRRARDEPCGLEFYFGSGLIIGLSFPSVLLDSGTLEGKVEVEQLLGKGQLFQKVRSE